MSMVRRVKLDIEEERDDNIIIIVNYINCVTSSKAASYRTPKEAQCLIV